MLVIPISSNLYETFTDLARTYRMVFMTGLPGTGKTLMIQQLSLIANKVGRKVHLLQYTPARQPFETEANLAKYPEIEGFTDPAIRKAVGLWARKAVQQWHEHHPDPEHLLIGELPLIGNRLTELVKVYNDAAEPLLSSEQAMFVIPVPSWEVRAVIEERRARTLADPQNEQERLDAPPNVLRTLWEEVNAVARQIGLTKVGPATPYNPYIYGGVYDALLRDRQAKPILIDQVLHPTESVYELNVVTGQLLPDSTDVDYFMSTVESSYTERELRQAVAEWHAMITDNPKVPDPGPELGLPLPEALPGIAGKTTLTGDQRAALKQVTALPVDAEPNEIVQVLDQAMSALTTGQTKAIKAEVHKFDVYDGYFNVSRTDGDAGLVFITGLLQAYRNVLADLQKPPQSLTVVELPLLRIALETSLRPFGV